ncbi:MAG: T9SS type A sorting domain-containing protein [Bacteroidetes bacterium]|nr:T9SS type A sorting domain-containing protein [Bacteroidota bacterium]
MKKLILLFSLFIFSPQLFAQRWTQLAYAKGMSPFVYSSIRSLCTNKTGKIYMAGSFTDFGSSSRNKVYAWNGSDWELGLTAHVNDLNAVFAILSIASDTAGNIYAAGQFINDSGETYVAKFDGKKWQELGTGTNRLQSKGNIGAICIDKANNVYIGTVVKNSSATGYNVFKWDGKKWTELGNDVIHSGSEIFNLIADKFGNIYTNGTVKNANGYEFISKWDGTRWSQMDSVNPLNADRIITSAVDTFGNIYASILPSGSKKAYIAKWDGKKWTELGSGADVFHYDYWTVGTILIDDTGNVYVAGYLKNAKGNGYVAKWNGSKWIELGENKSIKINKEIYAMCMDKKGNLYLAGTFADSTKNPFVAKYGDEIVLGNVTTSTGSSLKSSPVYLIKYNTTDSTVKAIDTTVTDTNGKYYFTTLDSNLYLFAWPDSVKHPTELPTWRDTALVFRKAKPIVFTKGLSNTNINFSTLAGANPKGKGFIGGKVTKCTGCKMGGSGKPVPNFKVLLYDTNGKAVAYAITDTGGNFSFKNIAISSYKIWVDKPLINNAKAPTITLTSTTPKKNGLSFILYTDHLELDSTITIIESPSQLNKGFKISPNPTSSTFTIQYTTLQKEELTIYNILGEIVFKTQYLPSQTEKTIDVSALPKGVYFVRVGSGVKKVVVE